MFPQPRFACLQMNSAIFMTAMYSASALDSFKMNSIRITVVSSHRKKFSRYERKRIGEDWVELTFNETRNAETERIFQSAQKHENAEQN